MDWKDKSLARIKMASFLGCHANGKYHDRRGGRPVVILGRLKEGGKAWVRWASGDTRPFWISESVLIPFNRES